MFNHSLLGMTESSESESRMAATLSKEQLYDLLFTFRVDVNSGTATLEENIDTYTVEYVSWNNVQVKFLRRCHEKHQGDIINVAIGENVLHIGYSHEADANGKDWFRFSRELDRISRRYNPGFVKITPYRKKPLFGTKLSTLMEAL